MKTPGELYYESLHGFHQLTPENKASWESAASESGFVKPPLAENPATEGCENITPKTRVLQKEAHTVLDVGTTTGIKLPKVTESLQDKIERAAKLVWFDGTRAWVESSLNKEWERLSCRDLSRWLRVHFNLNPRRAKGQTASEIDKAIVHIHDENMVHEVVSYVHQPSGIIIRHGERRLNIGSKPPIPYLAEACPQERWPWINNFLKKAFRREGENYQHEQLCRFLTWLQLAYRAGIDLQPRRGHILFLADPTELGKNLLLKNLICEILGGGKDVTECLLGAERFTEKTFHFPVLTANSAEDDVGRKDLSPYYTALQRIASFRFDPANAASWNGRFVVTCKTDPRSIRMLPPKNYRIENGLLILHMSSVVDGVGMGAKQNAWENGDAPDLRNCAEIPAFLRWLIEWNPPQWINGEESYYAASLLHQADMTTQTKSLEDVLGVYFDWYFGENNSPSDFWTGSSTGLLQELLSSTSPVRGMVPFYSAASMGRNLAQLMSLNHGLVKKRMLNGKSVYQFPKDKWIGRRKN